MYCKVINTTSIYCFKRYVTRMCLNNNGWFLPLRPDLLRPVPVFVSPPRRREPEHGQRHQQPGAVAHSLLEEAGAGRCAVPDGSAAPGDPRGRPPPAHHPDEVRRGLRLQGGVRGRTPTSCHLPHPQPLPLPVVKVANTNETW